MRLEQRASNTKYQTKAEMQIRLCRVQISASHSTGFSIRERTQSFLTGVVVCCMRNARTDWYAFYNRQQLNPSYPLGNCARSEKFS